jgi:methionine synthase I (cobalamin-dependent)
MQVFALPECETENDDEYVCADEFPTSRCPICQLKEVTQDDMMAYLLKQRSLTKEQIKAEIIETFTDLKSFREAIK